MNNFPVGSMVKDKRDFADDLPCWEVISAPVRGSTCTWVQLQEPNGRRKGRRNVAFLVNINFIENE